MKEREESAAEDVQETGAVSAHEETATKEGSKKGAPVIELEGVEVSYGGRRVLRDVNLTVRSRDYLGIIGPNGGGKSTLLKVIVGLKKPDAGRVRVLGRSPAAASSALGYVPQEATNDLRFPATVWDVVLMGRAVKRGLFKRYTRDDEQRAEAALKRVHLLDLKARQIGALSGGQRQRVYIARALAGDPELLILDEPTAALDSTVGKSLYGLLDELNHDITIVMVTHDMSVISRSVTSVACLSGTIFSHEDGKHVDPETLEKVYGCPIDLIAHGNVPHRVLPTHRHYHEET